MSLTVTEPISWYTLYTFWLHSACEYELVP